MCPPLHLFTEILKTNHVPDSMLFNLRKIFRNFNDNQQSGGKYSLDPKMIQFICKEKVIIK